MKDVAEETIELIDSYLEHWQSLDAALEQVIEFATSRIDAGIKGSLTEVFSTGFSGEIMWFETLIQTHKPPAGVKGMWFGMFNPILEDGSVSADFYIGGATNFASDDPEWACSLSWNPPTAYAGSETMRRIYSIANESEEKAELEYTLQLGFLSAFIRDLADRPVMRSAMKNHAPIGLAVGFDAGDEAFIGYATESGIRRKL